MGIYKDRLNEAYRDILSDRPVRFHLPLNEIFHEVGQDEDRLAAAGVDVEEFRDMQALGFAKETLGMTGHNLHRVYREVIHTRCHNLLYKFGANRLEEGMREKLLGRKLFLEATYPDLKP